jgi:primosomal protein N' (replication factor Y)
MIKFYMMFYDVLFPVNIGPLTYRCDDTLSHDIKPGMIVSAPLKNRVSQGIVIAESEEIPPVAMKDIQKVMGDVPVLSDTLMNLLRWMSEYYVAEQGLVLKNMLPKEAYIKVKQRKRKTPSQSSYVKKVWGDHPFHGIHMDASVTSPIIDSLKKEIFKTFLFHAPSSAHEGALLGEVLKDVDNAIILVPEVSLIDAMYQFLKETCGYSVCLFHSGLSKGKKSEAIERILSGHARIVLGTRSAIFAPLKKVSLIAVLQEHNSSYKQENSPCYHGRDVAVKRGYLEKATVLLSSICPSVESLYNCRTGKYKLLQPSGTVKRPKMNIIDMRFEKLMKPSLTKTVVNASLRHIKKEKKVMFVMNRRGYSTILQCMDCSHREECPHCGVPIVFHKQDMSLKCHYCGHTLTQIPEQCSVCKGFNIQLLGAGTQRVKEDIEELIGIKTMRIDSDKLRKKSDREGLVNDPFRDDYRILVGTKLMTRRLTITENFSMAAILNADQFLNIPDFKSAEKAFQEISMIADKIETHGEIYIQTRMPDNYLYRYVKNYSYAAFSKEEMNRRKTLRYPPYAKLLLLKFISKRDFSEKVSELSKKIDRDVDILGPSHSKDRGLHEIKLLLKSSSQEKLHSGAKIFTQSFKDPREVRIKVDVDPIVI